MPPTGNVYLDYLNRILDFLNWCEANKPGHDPRTGAMCYRFLTHANDSRKAGTYAGRFLCAFNWFTARAEIFQNPKEITKVARIQSEKDTCAGRKDPKKEARPLPVAAIARLEEIVTDCTQSLERRSNIWLCFVHHWNSIPSIRRSQNPT